MRKYVAGIAVGLVFLAYSLLLRHQHSKPVVAPMSLAQNHSTSSTPGTVLANKPEYKNGTFTGSVANAFYGNVQVSATINNGKITAVNFLQYPNDNPNSLYVNDTAMPYLKQEAISAQSSNVSIVTGATFTSQAFTQSLTNALNQAKQN